MRELTFDERSAIYMSAKKNSMLKQIDDLRESVQKCIDDELHWRKTANRSKEEVASEIKNEHDKENAYLKEELRLAVVTLASDLELERYNAFCKKHESCRMRSKHDGGKIPYIIQYGTGIGVCSTVYCQVCGEHEEITDASVW